MVIPAVLMGCLSPPNPAPSQPQRTWTACPVGCGDPEGCAWGLDHMGPITLPHWLQDTHHVHVTPFKQGKLKKKKNEQGPR